MSRKFVYSRYAVAVKLGDSAVILDTASSKYFRLNKIGARIWDDIGDGRDQETIVERLKESFSSEAVRIPDDVSALIDGLLKAKLINRAHDDAE